MLVAIFGRTMFTEDLEVESMIEDLEVIIYDMKHGNCVR